MRSLLSRRSQTPTHSLCERAGATDFSPWHLRTLMPGEALRKSGGLNLEALCGTVVAWDVKPVSQRELEWSREQRAAGARRPGLTCAACDSVYLLLH